MYILCSLCFAQLTVTIMHSFDPVIIETIDIHLSCIKSFISKLAIIYPKSGYKCESKENVIRLLKITQI